MSERSKQIEAEIRARFARLATSPRAEQKFPVGAASAKRLGYDTAEIDALPVSATESFAGVGNPFALGEPRSGGRVFDLGCGAGLDCLLAARRVGPDGHVTGIDFAEEMILKAKRNAASAGLTNVTFLHGSVTALPAGDRSADLVLSNGVFNLCLDKPAVLAEAFRVLEPGGRLQMADILLEDGVSPEEVARKGAWSD